MNQDVFIRNLFSLEGKVALVTGGSKGLGRTIAETLSNAGAKVAICSRNGDESENCASEIALNSGRRVISFETDVRDHAQVQKMIGSVRDELGVIDILYANAGINIRKDTSQLSEDDWDLIMDINVKGAFFTAQSVIPGMKERGWGRIIFLASMLSYVSIAGRAAYASSKTALLGLTRTLSLELAPFNICVNALCPGPFKTPMNEPLLKNAEKNKEFIEKMPMGRWGMPKYLQGIALLLSSDACSYITGTGIVIDGGWTVQ